jgi:hyperosmotically inducible periplasmic protein
MSRPHGALLVPALTLGCTLLLGSGTVAAQSDDQPHSDSMSAAVSDTATTAKVKARFAGDERLKGSSITVHTTNGVVTLSGSAPSADASDAAEELAQSVSGVKSVDNQISAPSKLSAAAHGTKQKISDDWITTKVKSQLLGNRSIQGSSDISVRTHDGVVTLSGTATSRDALENAKTVARNVKGVKSVDASNLRLASSD